MILFKIFIKSFFSALVQDSFCGWFLNLLTWERKENKREILQQNYFSFLKIFNQKHVKIKLLGNEWKRRKKKQCISFKQPLNAYLSWRGSSFTELNARHFSWLYIFAMLGHLFCWKAENENDVRFLPKV